MKSEIKYIDLIDKITNKENILMQLIRLGHTRQIRAIKSDYIDFSSIFNMLTDKGVEQLKYECLVCMNEVLNKLIYTRYLKNIGFTLSKNNIQELLSRAIKTLSVAESTKINFIEIKPSELKGLKSKLDILGFQLITSKRFSGLMIAKNSDSQITVYSTDEFVCDTPLLFDIRTLDNKFNLTDDDVTIHKDNNYELEQYEDNIGTLRCNINGIEKEIGLKELIEINQKNYNKIKEKLEKQIKTFESTFKLDEIKIAFLIGASGLVTREQLNQPNVNEFAMNTFNTLINNEKDTRITVKRLTELLWSTKVNLIMPYIIKAELDKNKKVAIRIIDSTLVGRPTDKEKIKRYYNVERKDRELIKMTLILGEPEQEKTEKYPYMFNEGMIPVTPSTPWIALGVDSYNEDELISRDIIYKTLVDLLKIFKDEPIAIIIDKYNIENFDKLKKVIEGLKIDKSREFNINSTAIC